MSIYFTKYLKYKNKYLKLQKIIQTEEFLYTNSNYFKGGAWGDKSAVNKLKQGLEVKPKKVAINSNVEADKLQAKVEADKLLAKVEADKLLAKVEADKLQAEVVKLQEKANKKKETIDKIYNNILSSGYFEHPIIQLIFNLNENYIHTLINEKNTDLFNKPIFKYLLCYKADITSDIKKNFILTQKIILFVIGYINQVLFDNKYKIQYIIKGGAAFKFILSIFKFNEEEDKQIKNELKIPNNECIFESNDIDLVVRIDRKIDKNIKNCLCLVLLYKLYNIIFLFCDDIIYKSPLDLRPDTQERTIELKPSAESSNIASTQERTIELKPSAESSNIASTQERTIELQPSANDSRSSTESTNFLGVYKLSLKHSIFEKIAPTVLIDINPSGDIRKFFHINLQLSPTKKNQEFIPGVKIILYIEPITDFIEDKKIYYQFYQTQKPDDLFNLRKFKKYIDYFNIIEKFRPSFLHEDFMNIYLNNFDFYSIYCPGKNIPYINSIVGRLNQYNISLKIGLTDRTGGSTIYIYGPNIEEIKNSIDQEIKKK